MPTDEKPLHPLVLGLMIALVVGAYSSWLDGLQGGHLLRTVLTCAEFLVASAVTLPITRFALYTDNRVRKFFSWSIWAAMFFLFAYSTTKIEVHYASKALDTYPIAWPCALMVWVGAVSKEPGARRNKAVPPPPAYGYLSFGPDRPSQLKFSSTTRTCTNKSNPSR